MHLSPFSKGRIYWAFMELKGRPCRTPFNGNSCVSLDSPGPHGSLSLLHCVSVGFSNYSGGTSWPCTLRSHLLSLVEHCGLREGSLDSSFKERIGGHLTQCSHFLLEWHIDL